MTCIWIGINHDSEGIKKVGPQRRLTLELISFVLLLISWCFTISGIIVLDDFARNQFNTAINYLTGNRSPFKIKGTDCAASVAGGCDINITKAVGTSIFVSFNGIYTIVTFFLAILNVIYRREYLKPGQRPLGSNVEWAERKNRQCCFEICTPCNALRIFHHLEHRGAFIVNLICAILGVDFYFSIPLVILTLAQTILSYLYAEDIALCGIPICCFYLLFIRRYPKEDSDIEMRVDDKREVA